MGTGMDITMTREKMLLCLYRGRHYADGPGTPDEERDFNEAIAWLENKSEAEWCSAGCDNLAGYDPTTHGWVIREA